jgi:hypothetical protein
MNIIRFMPLAGPPKVKRKPAPRLRVVRDQHDVRLTRQELMHALDSWLPTLGGCTYVVYDNKYAWISIGATERHIPCLRYAVRRWTGDVFEVTGVTIGKIACGNIMHETST